MTKQRESISIGWVCSFFEKSRQSFYQILQRKDGAGADKEIIINYAKEYRKEMSKLGTRKMHKLMQPLLKKSEIKCGRDKLFSILGESGLLLKRHRANRCITRSLPISRNFPNLIKDLTVDAAEQLWVSDTTGIPVYDGLGYLTLTTDSYSKLIVGYNLQRTKDSSGSIKTLRMALRQRKYIERQLIHHSDGGKEYFNRRFLKILLKSHIKASCTAPSSPQENPVAERINGILKQEFLFTESNRSYADIANILPDVVRIYNERRPHLSIDMLTPIEAHSCSGQLKRHWKTYRKNRKSKPERMTVGKKIQQTMSSW